jgi:hypothetical protein
MSINGLGEIISALNPLGHISEMYSNALNYKLEAKRIEAEIQAMNAQAALLHRRIDAQEKIAMEKLYQRRAMLKALCREFERHFGSISLEREEVMRMAVREQKESFRRDASMEEKKHHGEMALTLIKQLHVFGNRASETLQNLIAALPVMESLPDVETRLMLTEAH